jgi:hypothetical protein
MLHRGMIAQQQGGVSESGFEVALAERGLNETAGSDGVRAGEVAAHRGQRAVRVSLGPVVGAQVSGY